MDSLAIKRQEPETQNASLSLNSGPAVEKPKFVFPGVELPKEFNATKSDHPDRTYGQFLKESGFTNELLSRPISLEKYEQIRKEAANAAQIAALTKAVQTLAAEVSQLKQQRGEVTPIPAQFTAAPSHAAEKATQGKPSAVVTAAPAEAKIAEAKQHPIASPDQTLQGTYTVKANETLSSIGAKLGHRYQDIAQWNNIEDANRIKVGQVLRLAPTDSVEIAAAQPVSGSPAVLSAPAPRSNDTAQLVETAVPSTKVVDAASAPGPSTPTADAKVAAAPTKDDGITITPYGRADLALSTKGDGGSQHTSIQNFNSRIGTKVERKLDQNLTATAQIESRVSLDDGSTSGALASRNSFVALTDKRYGTVLAGTNEMPLKVLMEGKVAPMWGDGDLRDLVWNGKGTGRGSKEAFNVSTRQTNVAQYISPKIENTTVKLAYSPAEGNAPVGTPKVDVLGASAEYDNGRWSAGYAYQNTSNVNGLGKDLTAHKAAVGWQSDKWTLGAGVSAIDNGAGRSTINEVIAATYKLDPKTTLKGTMGQSSESAPGAKDGFQAASVEIDYSLGKNTTLYANVAKIVNDSKGVAQFEEGSNAFKTPAGNDPVTASVGVRVGF